MPRRFPYTSLNLQKLCHSERSKIIRNANDLAESRNLLFAGSKVTLNARKAAAVARAPAAKRRKNTAQSLP